VAISEMVWEKFPDVREEESFWICSTPSWERFWKKSNTMESWLLLLLLVEVVDDGVIWWRKGGRGVKVCTMERGIDNRKRYGTRWFIVAIVVECRLIDLLIDRLDE